MTVAYRPTLGVRPVPLPWEENLQADGDPWTPAKLVEEGDFAWWRPDLGVTITGSGASDAVSQGTLSMTWIQGTDGLRPGIVQLAAANNKDCFDFDGTEQMQVSTSAIDITDGQSINFILVHYPTYASGITNLSGIGAAAEGFNIQAGVGAASRFIVKDGTTTTTRNGASLTQNKLYVQRYQMVGAASPSTDAISLWTDGVQSAVSNIDHTQIPTTTPVTYFFGSAGSGNYTGQVAEYIITTFDPSAAALANLTTYFNARYAQAWSGV